MTNNAYLVPEDYNDHQSEARLNWSLNTSWPGIQMRSQANSYVARERDIYSAHWFGTAGFIRSYINAYHLYIGVSLIPSPRDDLYILYRLSIQDSKRLPTPAQCFQRTRRPRAAPRALPMPIHARLSPSRSCKLDASAFASSSCSLCASPRRLG